jgi:membrane protease YdiL (CAAX protease family)
MLFGGLLVARLFHKRGWAAIFGPRLLAGFLPAMLITFAIGFAAALVAFGGGTITPVPNTPPTLWLTFLLPALVMLLIQTGAEEVLFRGYLQGQLAARFRSPIVWMVIPSLLFGALHVDPVSVLESGSFAPNDHLIFAATALVGLITADLTRVTGGLGAAWGLHFANNVQALLVVSLPDILSGLSLYLTPFGKDDTDVLPMLMLQDMVLLVIIWAAIRLYFARRG